MEDCSVHLSNMRNVWISDSSGDVVKMWTVEL